MADNRITKHRVKNHWAYSWWKYLLMAVCVIFGVNLYFTTTAYRPPEHKKVEIYLSKGWADAAAAQTDLLPVLMEIDPEQEELTVANIDLLSEDYYSVMQFTTYMAAQQGDILLIPVAEMKKYSSEGDIYGYFANLSPYLESGMLHAPGIALNAQTYPDASEEPGVFGIPADSLYGLMKYGIDPADSVLVVTAYSGNEEVCVRMLDEMIALYQSEKPDNYDAWHKQLQGASVTTQIFN